MKDSGAIPPSKLIFENGQLIYRTKSGTYRLCPLLPLEEKRLLEVLELSKQARFEDTIEDWKQHFRFARFGLAFIDTKTDRLVATGVAVVFENRVVRIIDIMTESSHRKKGLASLLFGHLLHLIEQDPHLESIELEASALGSPLYKKFSFQKEYEILSFCKQAAPVVSSKRQLDCPSDADLEQILALDRRACGFSRTALIREVPRNQIFVDREKDRIRGFAFFFEDRFGIRIGPWIHTHEESAEPFFADLFQIISNRYPEKKVYVQTPILTSKEDSSAIQILDQVGFHRDKNIQTYHHMSKGKRLKRDLKCTLAIWSTNWS